MSPVLSSSLSPHICVLQSPDLNDLLSSFLLPPLPKILQSFSPLPQGLTRAFSISSCLTSPSVVTTRTTSLTPVPHTSFALRFSDLAEIESACREPEEQRAVRAIDWIGSRINSKSA